MREYFDEISVQFWLEQRRHIQSKSYTCNHNGYVYGDNMRVKRLAFVYIDGAVERIVEADSPRKTYIRFVEAVCNQSDACKKGFMSAGAEKIRIFSEEEVLSFPVEKRNSTRIKDENSAIDVAGHKFYVANNLKICEFFNAAAEALTEEYRRRWHIRIFLDASQMSKPMKVVEELMPIEACAYSGFKLLIDDSPVQQSSVRQQQGPRATAGRRTDFLALGQKKKSVGDLGEYIVVEYEKKKLCAAGRADLAKKVVHTSQEIGDAEGYDIFSFDYDGGEMFIEVKSTKQDISGGFYLSQNELTVANACFQQGKKYRVYRLYKINERKGEAKLVIYEPPFNDNFYVMSPVSWFVAGVCDEEQLHTRRLSYNRIE